MVNLISSKLVCFLNYLLDKYRGSKQEHNWNIKYVFITQNFVLLYLKFIKVFYGIMYIKTFYYFKVSVRFCILLYVFIYLSLYKFFYIIALLIVYKVVFIMNIYYYVLQGYTFNAALGKLVLVREEEIVELIDVIDQILKNVDK